MRVLVVEDDELTAHLLTSLLTRQTYAVEVAADGETGREFVEAFDYDLVLLDVMLPKLDGISLCRQIRARGLQMPILLLTGKESGHDKAIGLDAGADDYVVKPFDPEELVARVRALLRRSGTTAQPVLEWGNLRLDPSSYEVTYGPRPLLLTPKEYALLELFLRHHGRVFSCGMILEHLWSYEEMPGEEAVRTHIKGLRQKLKAAGVPSDVIQTVYGIGYRLKPRQTAGIMQVPVHAAAAESPLLLIVDRDVSLAQALGTEATQQGFRVETAANLTRARAKFLLESPDVLLLDPASATTAESLALLAELKQQAHPLRVVILSQRDNLTERLNAAHLGGHSFLPKSTPVAQIIETVNQVLHQADRAKVSVMVVDDDPQLLAVVRALLEPWGLKVTSLACPQQFWQVLEATSPDLLVLDVEMPQISGLELCQIVRSDPSWNGLPILFLTTHTDADTVNQVFLAGADDLVSKPIAGPELVTRIINRLDRSRFLKSQTAGHDPVLADSSA